MPLVASLALGATGIAAATHWRAASRDAAANRRHPPGGRLLSVRGRQVHVHVGGAGPDLVLLHGAGGNLRDFTFDLVPRLEGRFRVIAFDRPGHGHTDEIDAQTRADGATPRQQAAFLQDAARQIGVDRALVVGHSFGASVAMAWALEDPTMTAGLLLLAGATMPWPGALNPTYRINAHPIAGRIAAPLASAWSSDAYIRRVLAAIFAPQPIPDGYMAHFGHRLSTRRDVLRANAKQVIGLFPHVAAMSGQYQTITAPVTMLHGTEDRIVPAHIHSGPLVHLLRDPCLKLLDGIGHMPHHAAPEIVTDTLDRLAGRAGLR